jgi:hypothetical protein
LKKQENSQSHNPVTPDTARDPVTPTRAEAALILMLRSVCCQHALNAMLMYPGQATDKQTGRVFDRLAALVEPIVLRLREPGPDCTMAELGQAMHELACAAVVAELGDLSAPAPAPAAPVGSWN